MACGRRAKILHHPTFNHHLPADHDGRQLGNDSRCGPSRTRSLSCDFSITASTLYRIYTQVHGVFLGLGMVVRHVLSS